MKIRSTIAAAIVSTAALAPFSSRADILSWTYAPSSKDDHGAKTIDGVTITPTYSWVDSTETSFAWTDSSLQIGVTGKAAYGVSYSIPASSFDGGITKVTLTAKVAKALNDASDANKSKVSVSVGGIALSPATTNLTSTATAYEFTSETTLSGEMVLSISSLLPKNNKTSYALYVQSIVVTYDDSPSGGGGDTPVGPVALNTPTDLAVSSITASGFTLSWTGDEHADSYEVEVLDGQGNAAGSVSGSVSPSGTVWTGLMSDTTYNVRVKALAAEGSEEYAHSALSEPKSVTTALAGGLVRKALFHDTFDNVPGTGWSYSGIISDTDEEGWTWSNAIRGPKGIRLGTQANPGAATTREIVLSNNMESADVAISFLAASYSGKDTAGTLTLSNTLSGATTVLTNLNPAAMSNAASDPLAGGTAYSFTATVPAAFTLRFESLSSASDRRLLLDSIKVTQVYNPNLTPLAAPVATAGEATITSLAFSWGAVAGATGYAVELRDGSGARVAYDAAFNGTATNFTDLAWNSDYTIRVKALGDDSTSCNSPWSEGVTGRTLQNLDAPAFTASADASAAVMAVVSNKTFSVSAERDGAPLAVSFGGLSPAASGTAPTFAAGAFSWTPSAGDEGTTFTATFTTDSGTFSTNIVFNVLARPALVEPVISVREISFNSALAEWDSPWQIRASSYSYRLWSGSDTASDSDTDCEHFNDRVVPGGWTLSGTTWQTSSGYNATPVAMTHEGDYVVSKLYDAPVTTLSFRIRRTGKADTPVVKFYASTGADRESAWNEVSIGEQDADYTNTDYSLDFSKSSNYRRFKWVYYEKDSNVNLGSVAAKYEGAGVKFKAGSATEYVAAPSGNVLDLTGLRSETNYFLEVRVADESGTKKSATLRFSTLAAPKMTLMVFR